MSNTANSIVLPNPNAPIANNNSFTGALSSSPGANHMNQVVGNLNKMTGGKSRKNRKNRKSSRKNRKNTRKDRKNRKNRKMMY